mgnify:CR=1 FL=1
MSKTDELIKEMREAKAKASAGDWMVALVESFDHLFVMYDGNRSQLFSGSQWSNPNGPKAKGQQNDFNYVALAANNMDKLLSTLEIATEALALYKDQCVCLEDGDNFVALKALEKIEEMI